MQYRCRKCFWVGKFFFGGDAVLHHLPHYIKTYQLKNIKTLQSTYSDTHISWKSYIFTQYQCQYSEQFLYSYIDTFLCYCVSNEELLFYFCLFNFYLLNFFPRHRGYQKHMKLNLYLCLTQRDMLPLKYGNMIVYSDGVSHKSWQSQRDTWHPIFLQKSQSKSATA